MSGKLLILITSFIGLAYAETQALEPILGKFCFHTKDNKVSGPAKGNLPSITLKATYNTMMCQPFSGQKVMPLFEITHILPAIHTHLQNAF